MTNPFGDKHSSNYLLGFLCSPVWIHFHYLIGDCPWLVEHSELQVLDLKLSQIMEVRSCKINECFDCIWFESNLFHVEDIEARKIIQISLSQLRWFIEAIQELLQSPYNFYLKNRRDDKGAVRLSEFRSNSGWFLRCIVWSSFGGRFFIHIHLGVSFIGWNSFVEMLSGFLKLHCWKMKSGSTPIYSLPNTIGSNSYTSNGPNSSYTDAVKKSSNFRSLVSVLLKQSINRV